MPAGRGGQKQAIADGNLILPTDFRTFCHVNIFRHTFCFRLKRLYLCISKGSARVLPFFVFFPLQMTIRPKQPCRTASFTLPLGPSELPSVALLDCRLGLVRILMGRMRQMGQVYLVEQMGAGKSRVRLFRNLNKFMTIPSGNPLSACGERGTGIFVSFAPFAGKNTLRRIIRIMRMQLAEQFVSSAPFADKNILRRMVRITRMPFEK